MTIGDRPGTKKFKTAPEAVAFAKERVAEYWIVHCRPVGDGTWEVNWWCQ